MTGRAAERATALLERWLEGMRGPRGYGGPVAHWWRDSLLYCGPGLDWRYEGIIAGYLTLFERTGRQEFLEKAKRAGDDLISGQLPDQSFRNSSFERNPSPAGTPHEAAANVGLLLLAKTLRARADPAWQRYRDSAKRNLLRFQLSRRWQDDARRFGDGGAWFVPNKAATMIEALCLLAEVTDDEEYLARYVAPTADEILRHQVREPHSPLHGAIAQASLGSSQVPKYFPYYIARSIPGLCAAYRVLSDDRYLDGAMEAGRFLQRWQDEDGSAPQVLYTGGRMNRHPQWVAGAADIVRAWDELRPYGSTADPRPTIQWILAGQLPSGCIRPATGFGLQIRQRGSDTTPDVRDLLPVVGWNDKAFRLLAGMAGTVDPRPRPSATDLDCFWRGRAATYREEADGVSVMAGRRVLYRWKKGSSWATWDAWDRDDGK